MYRWAIYKVKEGRNCVFLVPQLRVLSSGLSQIRESHYTATATKNNNVLTIEPLPTCNTSRNREEMERDVVQLRHFFVESMRSLTRRR